MSILALIFLMFIVGLIIGAIVIICHIVCGLSFKKKYSLKDLKISDLSKINPKQGSNHHTEQKETADGSGALKEFRR